MLRATAVSKLGVLFGFANAMRCTHGAANSGRNRSVDACRPGAVRNNQIALIPVDLGVLPRDRPLPDLMAKPRGAKKQLEFDFVGQSFWAKPAGPFNENLDTVHGNADFKKAYEHPKAKD